MTAAEFDEHVADMAEGGDHDERATYYLSVICRLMYSLHRSWGGKKVEDRLLDPWGQSKQVEAKPGERDPLRALFRAKHKRAEKTKRAARKAQRKEAGRGDEQDRNRRPDADRERAGRSEGR